MNLLLRVEPATSPEISADVPAQSSPLPQLESVNGDAFSIQNAEKKQARAGSDLAAGEALETVGKKSSADLRFTDGTVLMLSADTRVRQAVIDRTPGLQV